MLLYYILMQIIITNICMKTKTLILVLWKITFILVTL